ncbi:MAG: DNA-protecting protein DprA [Lachnospiraceae bacterium]|nr:DNA-protecting protein DprA [Lachnospiraceae bacterium]
MSTWVNCHNKYEYWFAGISSVPRRKKIHLRTIVSCAEEIYRMEAGQTASLLWLTERERAGLVKCQGVSEAQLEEQYRYCLHEGIQLVLWQDAEYPRRLRQIYNPPYGLYYRGKLPEEERKAAAVVGARNCSFYGKSMAESIGFHLAGQGISLISGMAAGIDGASHRGALQAGGDTYGVLGCGVDVCYPASHRELYESLTEQGGVLSEYPPHTQPLAMFFPQRNRIISGLSDVVIVVEAKEKSGSLITADFALEQGKEIYAVPGRVGDTMSQGTNRLISQGAGIFLSIEDFQKEMNLFAGFAEFSVKKKKLLLEKSERLVYSCLDLSAKNLDELMAETGLSLRELMKNLESLREKGCILELYKNYYGRREPDSGLTGDRLTE